MSLVGGVCTLTVCVDIRKENQWFLLVHDCASASARTKLNGVVKVILQDTHMSIGILSI